MNFGNAIEAIKSGKKVTRQDWNGRNMYLFLIKGATLDMAINANCPDINLDNYPPTDVIAMKTVNSVQVGWLASQTDMLANDWEIVLDIKQR